MIEFGKPFFNQLHDKLFASNFPESVSLGGDPSGYRSPAQSLLSNNRIGSPSQNRSVREFEEQMAALRKENFNLKLRIYFLEEKMPELNRMSCSEGQQSLMKQFVDNKVELEILQKDLEDKHQLLREAGEALTHMENVQQESETKYQAVIDELSLRVQCLEFENESLEKCSKNDEMIMNELIGRSNLENKVDMMQRIRELEGSVKEAEDKIKNLKCQIKNLEEIVSEKDNIIEEYENSSKKLNFQNDELNEQIELKDKTLISTQRKLNKVEHDLNELKQKEIKFLDLEEIVQSLKNENQQLKNDFETQKTITKEDHRIIKEQQSSLLDMKLNIENKRNTILKLSEQLHNTEKKYSNNRKQLEDEMESVRNKLKILQISDNDDNNTMYYDINNCNKLLENSKFNKNSSYFWNRILNGGGGGGASSSYNNKKSNYNNKSNFSNKFSSLTSSTEQYNNKNISSTISPLFDECNYKLKEKPSVSSTTKKSAKAVAAKYCLQQMGVLSTLALAALTE